MVPSTPVRFRVLPLGPRLSTVSGSGGPTSMPFTVVGILFLLAD